MGNNNFKFWVNNAVKCFISLLACNMVGYFFYLFLLNTKNTDFPEWASGGTTVLSLVVFVFSIYVTYRIAMIESQDTTKIDEKTLLQKTYEDSNYTLDYNKYFVKQVKTRLWSYYLVALLYQIPLIINYYISNNVFGSIYKGPISFYKFNMVSLWGCEILGKLWFIGPIIFTVIFSVTFTFLVYRGQKKWMFKPSYIK